MRRKDGLALASLLVCAACGKSAETPPDEASLRAVDEQQRGLIAARDRAGLEALAHPDLRINSPTNRILDRTELLGMVAKGLIDVDKFERTAESVSISGDLGIVMGHETVIPSATSESGAAFGAKSLQRRYTNIYRWEDGRWRFLVRHANVVAPRN